MKTLATVGLIPLFACWLCAQDTMNSNFEGTLIDEGCHNTRTEHHESSSTSNPATGSSTTTQSDSVRTSSECPITTSTTSFGMMTADGHYVHFDEPSNTRIVEYVKRHGHYNEPVKVKVVGSRKGDVIVMDTIQ
jgi:hypothetical protein